MSSPCAHKWGPCLAVVTGASRGFGAAVSRALGDLMSPGSVIVGISRTRAGVELLRDQMKSRGVELITVTSDLSCPLVEELRVAIEGAASLLGGRCSRAIIVHNAGSLGSMKYMSELNDWQHLTAYYSLNVCSVYPLNAAFMGEAKKLKEGNPAMKIQVVNVSSLSAVQPISSWALYCSGKAARDMAFRVLAAEEPQVQVLNYAPGPLDTDMHKEIREHCADEGIRQTFVSAKKDNKLLTCDQSVGRLLQVLESAAFKSGDHVDFYDDLPKVSDDSQSAGAGS